MTQVRVFSDLQKLVMPARGDVLRLLPQAQTFDVRGTKMMALPHRPESVRLLYNLGVKAPEPIRFYYDWAGTTPFQTQIDTAALLTTHRRAFVLNEMGTGKTRSAIFAYDYLKQQSLARKALVVAPLSTLVSVWEDEVFRRFHHLRTVVLHGSRAKRLKLLAMEADVYIINHDGVGVIQKELVAAGFDCVIIDEMAVYRNSRAERWKSLRPIVQKATHAWGLTGAPTPNEPTDAYGQVKLLIPENVSYSFKAFKDSTMRQITQFKWVPKDDANDQVFRIMQPSIRVMRADCLDLPGVTYSTRDVDLDPRAAKAYKDMLTELAAQVRTKQITAANEGVKLSKLLQISAGFAYDGEGAGNYVGGTGRIREVFDIVQGASGKVIVFAPFRFLTELLGAALGKRWDTAIIHGGTPKGRRDEVFTGFQHGTSPRVIVAHPATMAHGLTLTAADTIVWAAPTTSLEIYEQANARITRPGQLTHAHIIHIMSTKAEAQVYSRLQRKAKMQGALLDMFGDQ
jgi:SNF2 family DNA or RNA helicase